MSFVLTRGASASRGAAVAGVQRPRYAAARRPVPDWRSSSKRLAQARSGAGTLLCFALLCFAAAASLKLQLSATARGGRGEFAGACALEVVRLKEELRKMPPDEAPGVSAATVSLAPTAFHLSESPSPLNFMCLRLRLLRPKSCLKK